MQITDYSLVKLRLSERTVGDSQTGRFETDEVEYGYLTLETDTGECGYGFDIVNFRSPGTLTEAVLRSQLDSLAERMVGRSPFALLNRRTRHRGGVHNYFGAGSYGQGVGRMLDFALWDLAAKHLGCPLYELLGGEDPRVPVYASGLSFPNDDAATRAVYEEFAELGDFRAAKVKVGYPTVEEDVDRMNLVLDVLGADTTLLVDANEAWSPKETIRRARAYRDAGLDVYWIEDPVFRADVDGIRRIVDAVPFTKICMGDYVRFEGKRRLLERGACDVLNVHGISPARKAATLAHSYGTPVATGTDHGADVATLHVAASLPEVEFAEFVHHRFWELAGRPFDVEDGHAVAPDRPGHGVELADDVLAEHRVPE